MAIIQHYITLSYRFFIFSGTIMANDVIYFPNFGSRVGQKQEIDDVISILGGQLGNGLTGCRVRIFPFELVARNRN